MISLHYAARSDEVIIKALTHDPDTYPVALGCSSCPHLQECGGLSVKAPIFDCLDMCCNAAESCTRVCRKQPATKYVDQLREIGGFNLQSVQRAPVLWHSISSDIVPLVYHGSSRTRELRADVFALPLPSLVNFRRGRLHFSDRAALCAHYHIPVAAQIVITGVNLDHRIEPWWGLGERRTAVIAEMRNIGIDLVTTPNFSVVLDQPRTDDMHAIKRILITFAEFANGGIPCALHPNGRTERDFERWGDEIAARPEVTTLAYEFITGPGRKARQGWHLKRLADLATRAERKLDIVVRGDPNVIRFLRQHFRKVIFIETTAFMKTLKRQRLERAGNNRLRSVLTPTGEGEYLDELFAHNVDERIAMIRALHYYEAPSGAAE
jgi:hypothetical protein